MEIIAEMAKIIVGGSIGAGLTLYVERRKYVLKQKEERVLAVMMVATQLRSWMYRCADIVSDIGDALESCGSSGTLHKKLPDLPFEESMDQLMKIGPADSELIFDLIYEKNSINAEVRFNREISCVQDGEDPGASCLCGRGGEAYVQALSIYKALAIEVGWKPVPFPGWQLELMQRECKRWTRVQKNRENDTKV